MPTEPMVPALEVRDELLRRFSKALFRHDLDALYAVVTNDFVWRFHDGVAAAKLLADRAAIADHLASQKELFSFQRFEDVTYRHAGDVTFMTCRVDETVKETGERRTQRGVELYTFKDQKIAMKDVYRKPI